MVTGIEIAKLACVALTNCVSTYKTIRNAVREYKKAGKQAEELLEEIDGGILRIQNIATVLFKGGIIDGLEGANASHVLRILHRLEAILREYGEWITDSDIGLDYPQLDASSAGVVKVTAVAIADSSSNEELFEAIDKALKSQEADIIIFEKQFGKWKKLKWVVRDHSKLEQFKDDIKKWVESLSSALPAIVLLTAGLDMTKLSRLSRENLQYLPGITPAARRKALSVAKEPLGSVPQIDSGALTELFPGQHSSLKQMQYNRDVVLVEFKSYPSRRSKEDAMEKIKQLASLLKDGGVSGDLNVLECLGYVPVPQQLGANLVFKIPRANGRQAKVRPLSSLISRISFRSSTDDETAGFEGMFQV